MKTCDVCLNLGCAVCQPAQLPARSSPSRERILEARLAMAQHSAEMWERLALECFEACQCGALKSEQEAA